MLFLLSSVWIMESIVFIKKNLTSSFWCFMHFRKSWTRFEYFGKCLPMCLHVHKNFMASVTQKIMHAISWNCTFNCTLHKLMSIRFWWQSLKWWRYSTDFFWIFRIDRFWLTFYEVVQNAYIICAKIRIIRNSNDEICMHIAHWEALLYCFTSGCFRWS